MVFFSLYRWPSDIIIEGYLIAEDVLVVSRRHPKRGRHLRDEDSKRAFRKSGRFIVDVCLRSGGGLDSTSRYLIDADMRPVFLNVSERRCIRVPPDFSVLIKSQYHCDK